MTLWLMKIIFDESSKELFPQLNKTTAQLKLIEHKQYGAVANTVLHSNQWTNCYQLGTLLSIHKHLLSECKL